MEALDPALVVGLGRADAYPDDPSARDGIEHIQTHISHLFLTRERVYKLRKAVRFAFLDFSTRRERDADCLREVRLNRRLAPDVYFGVSAVNVEGDTVRVSAPREELEAGAPQSGAPQAGPPEHCVVMRRLADGRDAQTLLERGELRADQIDALAERVAEFHAAHPLGASPFAPSEWRLRVESPVRDSLEVLRAADLDPDERTLQVRTEQRAVNWLTERWPFFEARLREGRVVEGHADIQLQHVWFETDDSTPVVIDCVEFREDYRQMDPASDVAFLAMDLRYRHRAVLADRFLRTYAAASDDFGLYRVVDYFVCYRAAVRAKVAALACGDREISAEQRERAARSVRDHLVLASAALEAGGGGRLVAMAGLVGSGKSSVAAELADAAGGVVISSDRVRKRIAGLRPHERGRSSLYTPERTREVYAGLLERARAVLDGGRVAILDATYARVAHREELRRFAAAQGIRPVLVETRCARGETLRRLAKREAEGRDASDAGPELLETSEALYEEPNEWPARDRVSIRTDGADWRARVRELGARLRGI